MCAILLFLYPSHCYQVSICGQHSPSSGVRNRGEPKPLTRRESNPRPKDYASYAHPPPAVGMWGEAPVSCWCVLGFLQAHPARLTRRGSPGGL
jgi:hypothetical protein